MFVSNRAFSGFSVDNLAAAEAFYGQTLGLEVNVDAMGMTVTLPGGGNVFVYEKADHQPAGFTILNFVVDDIDAAVDQLIDAGLAMEHYDMGPMELDERGVFHSDDPAQGPSIAWFKDPAGNVLSVLTS